MSNHTTGPWTENACEVQAPDGSPICEMLARPEDRDKWTSANGGVADANSRLICAAPDLMAACKFALEYLEANEGEYGTEARIVACREAIAKAQGGVK